MNKIEVHINTLSEELAIRQEMKIVVRPPIPGDIGWLISSHGSVYADQYSFNADFELDIAKKVVEFLDAPKAFDRLSIAEIKGRRAGSIAVSLRPEKVAFLNFLLVMPDYRRRGVATTLMDTVIGHSRDHGARLLRLETYSCLEDARRMYMKYGFELCESSKNIGLYGQVFDQEFWELKL